MSFPTDSASLPLAGDQTLSFRRITDVCWNALTIPLYGIGADWRKERGSGAAPSYRGDAASWRRCHDAASNEDSGADCDEYSSSSDIDSSSNASTLKIATPTTTATMQSSTSPRIHAKYERNTKNGLPLASPHSDEDNIAAVERSAIASSSSSSPPRPFPVQQKRNDRRRRAVWRMSPREREAATRSSFLPHLRLVPSDFSSPRFLYSSAIWAHVMSFLLVISVFSNHHSLAAHTGKNATSF